MWLIWRVLENLLPCDSGEMLLVVMALQNSTQCCDISTPPSRTCSRSIRVTRVYKGYYCQFLFRFWELKIAW